MRRTGERDHEFQQRYNGGCGKGRNLNNITTQQTMKKTTKVQIKDLKPKKDAKGGKAQPKQNDKLSESSRVFT